MTNVVITSTANIIKIVFNDFEDRFGFHTLTLMKDSIWHIGLTDGGTVLEFVIPKKTFYFCTVDVFPRIPVASVNGTAPTDINHLYTLLEGLLG